MAFLYEDELPMLWVEILDYIFD